MTPSLLDLRWRGGGHVESWFFKANDREGRRALWLRATVYAKSPSADRSADQVPPVAEAWAVAFDRERGHVVTKSTIPFERARFGRGTLDVEIDGCELSLGHAKGAIANGGRALGWDLQVGPERAAPIVHLPAAGLYETSFPSTKLVTPLADARAYGVLDVQRSPGAAPERWDIDGWPAMIGHNWGRAHAHLYAWTHCNTWEDADDLVFEGVSARVRMGPVLSPMLTAVFLRYRGVSFDLNARELFGKSRGVISLRRWEATTESAAHQKNGRGLRVHADFGAETDDFVGLHYANPRGSTTHCLNTKLARGRIDVTLPSGESFVAHSRAAALEIGTRAPHHGVRMYV